MQPAAAKPGPGPTSGRKRALFAAAAVGLALLPLALFEFAARLAGWGLPSGTRDPFVGFSRIVPLFDHDPATGQYRTSKSRLYFFGEQQFAMPKPAGTLRAFCLGGSTVLGHPYEPATAFPKWLEMELNGSDPSRTHEVVNCGGMSYASYRLIPILLEVLQYEPDLIVVMTGHNEFLEDRTYRDIKQRSRARAWVEDRLHSLRTVTLLREAVASLRANHAGPDRKTILKTDVDARLDHESGYASYHRDEAWRKGVVAHFEHNLRSMIRTCDQAGVPLILVNPGSNLRDCPPFKSENSAGLEAAALARWTECFERGSVLDKNQPGAALEWYRRAAAIDDEHGQLAYRTARCLDRLGNRGEARVAYRRAKELDVCPLRILDAMQRAIHRVAAETGTPLVDAAALLEKRSRDELAGYDWYVDQVHPSIRGHQLIAQAVAARMGEIGLARGAPWREQDRTAAYTTHLARLGDLYLAKGRTRVEWLEHWARRDRLRDDTQPQDPRGFIDLGHSCLDFAERDRAVESYLRAVRDDPESAALLLDHASELMAGGRAADAARIAHLVATHCSPSPLAERARAILKTLEPTGTTPGDFAGESTIDRNARPE